MNDLFGGEDFPGVSMTHPRTSPENHRGSSGSDYSISPEPRKPGDSGKITGDPRHSGRGSGNTIATGHGRNIPGNLRDQRISLEAGIEMLEVELSEASRVQEPYKQAFDRAHFELVIMHGKRKGGLSVPKPRMLKAYDKRMLAGHAWNPFKTKAREIEQALKTYRQELKAVNKEIGI